jgi:capsular polysaccharide biosynthesis protein
MDQQPMNLRRAAKVTRRYKALIGVIALIGLVVGAGYAVINPPKLTSQALLVIPLPTPNIATQVVIAGSAPVLTGALPKLGSGETLQSLQKKITVSEVTPNAISVTAKDNSSAAAVQDANAVAKSYVAFITSGKSPFASVVPHILVSATSATGTSAADSAAVDGAIGLLAGLLVGLIAAAWRDRNEARLWRREQVAYVAGAPVLAALTAGPGGAGQRKARPGAGSQQVPGNAAGWVRFFQEFDPLAGSVWQLRTVIDRAAAMSGSGGAVTVLSVAGDRKALLLGPQLAAFAASTGTRTALVVGPQAPAGAAGLRAAAAADGQLDQLQIISANPVADNWTERDAELSVIVIAVDGGVPALPEAAQAPPVVLAVTAGAVKAAELARLAAAVRKAGSRIAGVIVGNPEADDSSSGRAPRRDGTAARGPAGRPNGRVTEMR